jgi:predicted Fe-Mo cluster-binding NifX family protein
MKIAVSANGGSMDAQLNERFGRCPYFVIYDTESNKFTVITNIGEQMQGGAGPKAAELIAKANSEVLITGHVGDKAKDALEIARIKIIDGLDEGKTVKNALEKYLNRNIEN